MQSTFNLYAEQETPVIACGEQPQQRIEAFGAAALSDTELIAILLHSGIKGHSVLRLASQLIAQAGSIAGLASWQAEDFRRIKGIGRSKGQQLAAMLEIGRRMMKSPSNLALIMDSPEAIAAHLHPIARGLSVEKIWVFCLNRKNRLKKLVELTSGTATAALAHPREVFRTAIQHGATAIAVAHNHPSGDPAPSSADIRITRQLRDSADVVDITLLDHVIVGEQSTDPTSVGFYSFREAGLL